MSKHDDDEHAKWMVEHCDDLGYEASISSSGRGGYQPYTPPQSSGGSFVLPKSTAAPTYRALGRVPMPPKTVALGRVASGAAARKPVITIMAQPAQSVVQTKRNSAAIVASAKEKKKGDMSGYVPPSPFGPGTGSAIAVAPSTEMLPPGSIPGTGLTGGPATAGPQVSPQVERGGGVAEQTETFEPEAPSDTTESILAKGALAVKSTSLAIAKPAVSLWQRIIAFFGFGKKDAVMAGEPTTLQAMVESVVRRARNGDQNAMALIALVRENALKGVGKAQVSFELMKDYVRRNPVSAAGMGVDYVALTQAPGTRWGVDPQLGDDSTFCDAVALSHGPKLLNPRIGEFLSRFGAEDQEAIRFGIQHKGEASERSSSKRTSAAIRMGKILGHARRLQAVRMAGSSLSKFDTNVGWELGDHDPEGE